MSYGVRVAVRVAKRDCRLVKCGRVNGHGQRVLGHKVRRGAIFPKGHEVRHSVDGRGLHAFVYRMHVRVLFTDLAQGPNDSREGVASALTLMDRLVGTNFDERLREIFHLCVINFNEGRSNGVKRVKRSAGRFVRPSATRLSVRVLRQGHVA